jgi:hypothetical protein
VPAEARHLTLETPLGLVDPGHIDVRSGCRFWPGRAAAPLGHGRRGEIGAGFSALQIDSAALSRPVRRRRSSPI